MSVIYLIFSTAHVTLFGIGIMLCQHSILCAVCIYMLPYVELT